MSKQIDCTEVIFCDNPDCKDFIDPLLGRLILTIREPGLEILYEEEYTFCSKDCLKSHIDEL